MNRYEMPQRADIVANPAQARAVTAKSLAPPQQGQTPLRATNLIEPRHNAPFTPPQGSDPAARLNEVALPLWERALANRHRVAARPAARGLGGGAWLRARGGLSDGAGARLHAAGGRRCGGRMRHRAAAAAPGARTSRAPAHGGPGRARGAAGARRPERCRR